MGHEEAHFVALGRPASPRGIVGCTQPAGGTILMVERRATLGLLAHAVMILGILIVAFPLFVFLMSMGQRALEKRKEARKSAEQDYLGSHWRGGW